MGGGVAQESDASSHRCPLPGNPQFDFFTPDPQVLSLAAATGLYHHVWHICLDHITITVKIEDRERPSGSRHTARGTQGPRVVGLEEVEDSRMEGGSNAWAASQVRGTLPTTVI